MADSAKVIFNKKEVRSNTGETPLSYDPFGKDASLPPLSPLAKEPEPENCREIRREIVRSRPLIDDNAISYMRLSLLNPKAADNDGSTFLRMAVNMDISFNNNPVFQKFKWRVTNKRSEFYANLPIGWETDLAYGQAWEYYNELSCNRWIGKATYRLNFRDKSSKMKLAPFTSIVMWTTGDTMNYRLWIENAEVEGAFNLEGGGKYFMAASQPIKNFKPSGMQIIPL